MFISLCVNSLITLASTDKNISSCFFLNVLQPRRADLDMNQHVNNVTYIGWVLEVCCFTSIIVLLACLFESSSSEASALFLKREKPERW
jgi:Acyl-ACP thioesterase